MFKFTFLFNEFSLSEFVVFNLQRCRSFQPLFLKSNLPLICFVFRLFLPLISTVFSSAICYASSKGTYSDDKSKHVLQVASAFRAATYPYRFNILIFRLLAFDDDISIPAIFYIITFAYLWYGICMAYDLGCLRDS